MHLIKRRANPHPTFDGAYARDGATNCTPSFNALTRGERTLVPLSTHPEQRAFSAPSPYSRKPGPFGENVSICAKGVSRGIHNIAFLLSPDDFRADDLLFFFPRASSLGFLQAT